MAIKSKSTNPVFGSLTKFAEQPNYQQTGGFGAQSAAYGGYQQSYAPGKQPKESAFASDASRAITTDDIIIKTGITLSVIATVAIGTFIVGTQAPGIALIAAGIGSIGALILVLVATFGKKYDSAPVTLTYAALEGLAVGGISYVFAARVDDWGSMILQAVLATMGVFAGMLYVYKTGAIKVTTKFKKLLTAGLFGVVGLALGNILIGMFTGNFMLTNGGPIAILFSLACIVIAALSFLADFDSADQLVRAGAPASYAWGVALGLAVTLVWLYFEILRLLSYFRD